jgi:hypothetical protein
MLELNDVPVPTLGTCTDPWEERSTNSTIHLGSDMFDPLRLDVAPNPLRSPARRSQLSPRTSVSYRIPRRHVTSGISRRGRVQIRWAVCCCFLVALRQFRTLPFRNLSIGRHRAGQPLVDDRESFRSCSSYSCHRNSFIALYSARHVLHLLDVLLVQSRYAPR